MSVYTVTDQTSPYALTVYPTAPGIYAVEDQVPIRDEDLTNDTRNRCQRVAINILRGGLGFFGMALVGGGIFLFVFGAKNISARMGYILGGAIMAAIGVWLIAIAIKYSGMRCPSTNQDRVEEIDLDEIPSQTTLPHTQVPSQAPQTYLITTRNAYTGQEEFTTWTPGGYGGYLPLQLTSQNTYHPGITFVPYHANTSMLQTVPQNLFPQTQ